MSSSTTFRRSMATVILLTLLAARGTFAQTYKVVHAFSGTPDGASPLFVKLIRDSAGNFYGTTAAGGNSDHGTVFRLDSAGRETILYSFSGGVDGSGPAAGVIRDKSGNLYGTTAGGGAPCFEGEGGCGVVFKLTATGEFALLHSFLGVLGGGDGGFPYSPLLRDYRGNLYGATVGGGISTSECQEGAGTVFKLVQTNGGWTEILLHQFDCTLSGGMFPYGALLADRSGNVYGTTAGGGTCGGAGLDRCGTVFQITPGANGWTQTVLYGFSGGSDGAAVQDGLVQDPSGNFYGTTQLGGDLGFGTIFKMDSSGKKTVIHSFAGFDGAYPVGGLAVDRSGNLFGMAKEGGEFLVGTIFELDTTGRLTVLHDFAGGNDGAYPEGTLLRVGRALYGTTTAGGASNQGTVFWLKP